MLIFIAADMHNFFLLVFLFGCSLAQSVPVDFTAESIQLPCKAWRGPQPLLVACHLLISFLVFLLPLHSLHLELSLIHSASIVSMHLRQPGIHRGNWWCNNNRGNNDLIQEGVGIAIEPLNKAMLNAACDFPQRASTVSLPPSHCATLNKTEPENDEPINLWWFMIMLSVKHDSDWGIIAPDCWLLKKKTKKKNKERRCMQ